jgi:hypothetical protein
MMGLNGQDHHGSLGMDGFMEPAMSGLFSLPGV